MKHAPRTPQPRVRPHLVPFAALALFAFGCHHTVTPPETGPDPVVYESPCDPDVVYFVQDVLPLLVSSCAQTGCHNTASHEDGIILESYEVILAHQDLIVPGDPGESELIEVLYETGDDLMPPAPNAPLTTEQINTLSLWIEQGALNLSCSECDTTSVTFSGSILPLLNSTCAGCHSGSSPSGGVSLTNHAEVVAAIGSNNLMPSIRQEAGASVMPPAGNPLNECQVQLFEIWIAEGMPNN